MSKERVGIISIHYGVNFGSALQAIALSRYLKDNYNFDKVDVINYIPQRFRRITPLSMAWSECIVLKKQITSIYLI